MNPGQKAGVFYWRKIAKGEKDKQPKINGPREVKRPKTSGQRQAAVKRGEETRHSSYSSHKRITKPLQCGAQTDAQFCGLISASIIVSDAVLKPKDKTSEKHLLFPLRAWMSLVINISEMLEIEMGINLGCRKIAVSEQFLYCTQIGTGF